MSRTDHRYYDVSHFRMPYKDVLGQDPGVVTTNGVRTFTPSAKIQLEALAATYSIQCGTGLGECPPDCGDACSYGGKYTKGNDALTVSSMASGLQPLVAWKTAMVAAGNAVLLLKPKTGGDWPMLVALAVSGNQGARIANISREEDNVLWEAPPGFDPTAGGTSDWWTLGVIAAGVVGAYLLLRGGGSKYKANKSKEITIGYDVYNVFQRYWWGQGDPLYAILSRRGTSVSRVKVRASEDEIDRMKDVAEEILQGSDSPSEVRVAKGFLKRL